jgi:hypothetical protein
VDGGDSLGTGALGKSGDNLHTSDGSVLTVSDDILTVGSSSSLGASSGPKRVAIRDPLRCESFCPSPRWSA